MMQQFHAHSTRIPRQRGVTLIIGLIMLVVIILMVVTAFSLSSTNLKSVGNMQEREQAMAAANVAIEQLISSPFTNDPAAAVVSDISVDINNDDVTDYSVHIATPVCIRAVVAAAAAPSDAELGSSMSAGSTWNTDWDIDATVTDAASGTKVEVHQGIRVVLSSTQKTAVCP